MSADTLPIKHEQPFAISPIEFEATKDELRAMVAETAELIVSGITDTDGIAAARAARLKLKDLRVSIERRRKSLKADSLEYGRKVDSVAKELTAIIEPEEKRLEYQEQIVKREQERLSREAEERRQAMIRARLKQLADCGEVWTEAEVKDLSEDDFEQLVAAAKEAKEQRDREAAEAEAERQRVAEANRLEAERLAKERAEIERKQAQAAERLKRAQARLELLGLAGFQHTYTFDQLADMEPASWEQLIEQARTQKAERDRAAREEQERLERQKREQAEAQAKIDAEKKRIADEEAARKRRAEIAKAQEQEQEREANEALARAEAEMAAEARKPDREKLLGVADAIDSLAWPDLSPSALDAGQQVILLLEMTAEKIREIANRLVNVSEQAKQRAPKAAPKQPQEQSGR